MSFLSVPDTPSPASVVALLRPIQNLSAIFLLAAAVPTM